MKEDALRLKQTQHEELNRLRESRKKLIQNFDNDLSKLKLEHNALREELAKENKALDDLVEK